MPKYDIQNQELYNKIPKTTGPAKLSQIPQWIYGYCTDLNHEVCVWWNKNWQKRINFEADLGLSNIVPCPAIMQLIVLYNNLFFKFARLHNHHCCRPTYNFNLLITIIDLQQWRIFCIWVSGNGIFIGVLSRHPARHSTITFVSKQYHVKVKEEGSKHRLLVAMSFLLL